MRSLILSILTLAGVASLTSPASAQYFRPRVYGGYYYPPSGLTNYPTVYNPWARYNSYNPYYDSYAYNLAVAYNTASILNPSLYGGFGYNGYSYQNFGFSQVGYGYNFGYNFGYNQAYGYGVNTGTSFVQQEVGGFVPVNRNTAVNPLSGTILKPNLGVALTREGPFYQVPGTGSITAWGSYVPGSGVYVNPLSGTQYNPSSGLIVRP